MNMKPFTDPQTGIRGLKPVGWTRGIYGIWERASDQSMLLQRGIPNMTTEQTKALIRMYDLPRLQERTGRHKTAAFQWDLYKAETKGPADETFAGSGFHRGSEFDSVIRKQHSAKSMAHRVTTNPELNSFKLFSR